MQNPRHPERAQVPQWEQMFLPLRRLAEAPAGTDDGVMVLDDSVLRRSDALREMMTFARAIVEDGEVSETEAKGLHAWIHANPDVAGLPQVDQLVGILTNYFSDGRLSDRERTHLAEMLERFGG